MHYVWLLILIQVSQMIAQYVTVLLKIAAVYSAPLLLSICHNFRVVSYNSG
jgi:hypothetical protein